MVKGLILDLDGTLLDSMWVWRQVDINFIKNHGLPLEDEYLVAMKDMNFHRCAEYTRNRYGLQLSDDEMMAEWATLAEKEYAENVTLKEGVKDFLRYAKSIGLRLSVATLGYTSLFFTALKKYGIYDLFDAFTTNDDGTFTKNSPEIYYKAAERIGCKADECIVFEDILIAAKTAKSAGFHCIAMHDGHSEHEREMLIKTCDLYCENFNDRRIYDFIGERI